jgi:DNA polymerase/3'-5' exonuclease PolX
MKSKKKPVRVRSPENRVDFGEDDATYFYKTKPTNTVMSPPKTAKSPIKSIIKSKHDKNIDSSSEPMQKKTDNLKSTNKKKKITKKEESSSTSPTPKKKSLPPKKIIRKDSDSSSLLVKPSPNKKIIQKEESSSTSPTPKKSLSPKKKPSPKKKVIQKDSDSSSSPVKPSPKKKVIQKDSDSSSSPVKPSPKKKVIQKDSDSSSSPVKPTPKKDSSSKKDSLSKVSKQDIIDIMRSIANHYENSKDPDIKAQAQDVYRAIAFSNAAELLETYNGPFKEESLLKVVGKNANGKKITIGPHTAATIVEIYKTGESKRLKQLRKEALQVEEKNPEYSKVIELFQTVKYIGPEKADKLYKIGYRSIKDIEKNKKNIKLTDSQKLALYHYDDLMKKIPRKEMNKWRELFIEKFKCEDYLANPRGKEFTWALTGSYRRGAKQSSDLDLIILTKKGEGKNEKVLNMLKKHKKGIFGNGPRSLSGLVRLDKSSPVRYIDITNFREEEWPYGLLHSTGSANFVKLIQQRATDLDYTVLNKYGLFYEDNKRISLKTEEAVFNKLKVVYLAPEERGDKVKLTTIK